MYTQVAKKANDIRPYRNCWFYTPIVILSVLKLYILTLPEIQYFCLISPNAVLMSFTHLVFGRIAQDFFSSVLTKKTP